MGGCEEEEQEAIGQKGKGKMNKRRTMRRGKMEKERRG